LVFVVSTMLVAGAAPAAAAPVAVLGSEDEVSAGFSQGVARTKDGWIFTARFQIVRVDEDFEIVKENRRPIPSELITEGYNHVGDIDVVGKLIYAALEQGDYSRGEQVTAVYKVKNLKLVDFVRVPQNENSFVTIDPDTMIAYSFMDFGGQALLRYDVENDWEPLDPIPMSLFVDRVQGADIAGGYAWLMTDDATNGMYRVDLETGETVNLGSAGHVEGEGEGIDATDLSSGLLHTMVIDEKVSPVYFAHWDVDE
jgi:hypothetical protein